jgi:hypothetical protein
MCSIRRIARCATAWGRLGQPRRPDLRESSVALDRDTVWTVLHEGALMKQGMPRFEELTRAQSDKLYKLLRATAREALGLRNRRSIPPRPGRDNEVALAVPIAMLSYPCLHGDWSDWAFFHARRGSAS